ncbi:unnamed protein product [Mytilus edulis]|uniref:Uncharacterized protein n=1 Tax=Mytilus edulis TaxID=6550 RepID=A0A8S3UD77_MYTED|nr:unnamed protein product [Mytilus edulis]
MRDKRHKPSYELKEEHVSRVDTKSVEYAYKLDSVTKQISNLLLKTSRLNVLVDKLQEKANLGEKNSENGFSILSTSDAYNECSLKVMENNDSTGLDKIPFMENDEASDEENIEYKSDNECCSAGANINLSRNVNVPTIGSLTHNAVQYYESNINPNQPLGENCETKFFKKIGTCSDKDIGQILPLKVLVATKVFLMKIKLKKTTH